MHSASVSSARSSVSTWRQTGLLACFMLHLQSDSTFFESQLLRQLLIVVSGVVLRHTAVQKNSRIKAMTYRTRCKGARTSSL